MSEPNTTIHNETTQLPPDNGGNAGQPAATAAEPKNAQPTAEQPAPEAPTKVEDQPATPSSPHVGLIARAKENWDVLATGAVIGVGIGLVTGAVCFGGKKEAAVVV